MEPNTSWPPAPPLPQRAPANPIGEPRPPYEEHRPSFFKRTLGPLIAAIIAFAAKFKTLLLLLPKLKLFTTAGTMFVSVAA